MQKTKDDEFLGDSLTHNIQYSDNVWQAHGTVDRGSVYTKEPLLDLLFEGFDYDRQLGDYENYVARASTENSGDVSKRTEYSSARLQHDLYVLDTRYYSTSAIASSHNIFSLTSYLQKAVALSNPVYDDNSVSEKIYLFGVQRASNDNLPSDFQWNNPSLKKMAVFDVLKYVLPDWHLNQKITSKEASSKFAKLISRYSSSTNGSSSDNEGAGLVSIQNRDPSLKNFLIENLKITQTFEDFLNTLNNATYEFFDSHGNSKRKGVVADLFLEDFVIYKHNTNDIKLPFYNRGKTVKGKVEYKETEDVKTFKTRFLVNSLTSSLYTTGDAGSASMIKPVYLETLNDILEEAIFTNFEFYPSRPSISGAVNSSELAGEILNNGKYSQFYDREDIAQMTLLNNYIKAIDYVDTAIGLYCPEVYTGYVKENSPEKSWGIHFINEENTENLFQDSEKTYKLFNNVLIGYLLADTLIANRTCIGGLYYLIRESESDVITPISLDIPLNKRSVFKSFYDCSTPITSLPYYPTVTAINAIYKLCNPEPKLDAKGAIARGTDNEIIYKEFTIPEVTSESHSYAFSKKIEDWLKTECFLFKGNVYGDYVEELNFLQDLTPDSDVKFNSLKAKKTEIPYSRHQDSKYEVPYIEQTIPLINNTRENLEGLGVYANDSLASIGNLKGTETDIEGLLTRNVTPPFLYDYDKGDQRRYLDSVNIDPRLKNLSGNPQRVNPKNNKGVITGEQRILSPTIDELWTFLKYLTESDGSGVDKGVNERLPKFYGIQKVFIQDTISKDLPASPKNTVNPRVQNINTKTVDILNWAPTATKEPNLHWSPELNSESGRVELQFGGYEITRYIERVYDYEVKPFSRRNEEIKDDSLYEYNTEVSNDKNNVKGYLEKLYNSAILAFDLPEVSTEDKLKSMVNVGLLYANVLEASYESTLNNSDVKIFTVESDNKLITKNVPLHNTVQRKKAFDDLANILNYHKADGETLESSKHNHYKKYLENPKNLKEIERDLETIRQNLQTLVEFSVASFASLGYADRAQNRGTLHQLHKNAYEYLSTFIYNVNNTIANLVGDRKGATVSVNALETDLNNVEESLVVENSDKRVVFDDGDYTNRYLRENYDSSVLDLSGNAKEYSRGKHQEYRANETLLSEVYLAADGTWRSVHEHTVLPVIYSEH